MGPQRRARTIDGVSRDDSQAAPSEGPVDVDVLVHELKERVASEQLREPYDGDGATAEADPSPPPAPAGLTLQEGGIVSRRRVIGPLITALRRFALRLVRAPVEDLARQTLAAAQAGLAAEAEARERAERDLRQLARRVNDLAAVTEPLTGLEASLDQLEIGQRVIAHEQRLLSDETRRRVEGVLTTIDQLQVAPRLARLERERGVPAAPAARPHREEPATPSSDAIDYYAFEGRFRPEETVRERQQAYVEVLRGHEPVVDLGCGRGELVELLTSAGTRAYGVDLNPDFVGGAGERGIEIVEADALAHLASVGSGSLGGVVASHLVEHLPGEVVAHLVKVAYDRLGDQGVLLIETPNPESLIAGSVNFHRDPTHVRPIHPETLEFLCRSAGFGRVEVKRLSPTPQDELLPQAHRTGGPLAGDLNAVVDALNERLYGYQDYAVLAWK